ncbi:hypothetical protein [Deinococcus sp.]|uniref:hypothetical protein n=1 Tax=Deinococcus sp. TaxID=47478 RepID=UPI003C7A896A
MAFKPGSKSEYIATRVLKLDPGAAETLKGEIREGRSGFIIRYYEHGKRLEMALASYLTGQPAGRTHYWRHLNGDLADCRVANLERVNREQHPNKVKSNALVAEAGRQRRIEQARKDGKFIGVVQMRKKYYARLLVPGTGKLAYFGGGGFEHAEDAARAYDAARIEHGLQAVNFPGEPLVEPKARTGPMQAELETHAQMVRTKISASDDTPTALIPLDYQF